MRSRRSVRLRITLLATVVVAAALAVAAGGIVWTVERSLLGDARSDVSDQLAQTVELIESGHLANLDEAVDVPHDTFVEVYDDDGDIVAGGRDEIAPHWEGPATGIDLPPGVLDTQGIVSIEGPDLLVGAAEVEGPDGPLKVVAGNALVEVRRGVDSVVRALLLAVPALLVVVGATSWVVVGRALQPIEALRRDVEDITHSTLDRRVPHPGTDDEVGRLAATLNGMLDRLEGAARRKQEFVSDASHELRSPVAAIRTELEVALRYHAPDWPAVARRALQEDRRLEELVDDLLLLARLDESAGGAVREPVDLRDLAHDEAARISALPVEIGEADGITVSGDARQLARVMRNLLDNAARHARQRVRIDVAAQDDHAVLAVEDDGPGIPQDQREHIFDRFVRLDQSRDRRAGGVGLGLSLARRICQAHGGSIMVTDAGLGGARIEVTLPLHPSAPPRGQRAIR